MLSDLIQKSYSILHDNIDHLRNVTSAYDVDKKLGNYWEVTKHLSTNLLRECEEIANQFWYQSIRFLEIFSKKVIKHIKNENFNWKQEKEGDMTRTPSTTTPSSSPFSGNSKLLEEPYYEQPYYLVAHIPCQLEEVDSKKHVDFKSLLTCKKIGQSREEKYAIECLNQGFTFGRILGSYSSGNHAFKNAFAALSVANGLCHSEAFMSHEFYKLFENFILQSANRLTFDNNLDYEVTSCELRKALKALKENQTTELQLFADLASSVSILDDAEGLKVEYAVVKLNNGTCNSFTHAFILPKKVFDLSKVKAKVSWITMICQDDGVNVQWYQLDSNHIGDHFIGN